MLHKIKKELSLYKDEKKAEFSSKFFQVFEGGYGNGDKFLGIKSVQNIKDISKKYFNIIPLEQVNELLQSKWHEKRLLALDILVNKYQKNKKTPKIQEEIYNLYLYNIQNINNWDLVDSSCYKIVGDFLIHRDKSILFELADDEFIWAKRISIVSTMAFIKKINHTQTTYDIAKKLLNRKEDILQKATGWLMREAGKKNKEELSFFLEKNYNEIPRTTLRYAIEKFPEEERKNILKGIFI